VDYQRQSRKVAALKFKIRRVVYLPDKGQGVLFPGVGRHAVVVRELKEAGISLHEAWEIWQQVLAVCMRGCGPLSPPNRRNEAFRALYPRENPLAQKRNLASGKVETSRAFCRRNTQELANPNTLRSGNATRWWKRSKVNKKRKTQTESLRGRRQRSKKRVMRLSREHAEELARNVPRSP